MPEPGTISSASISPGARIGVRFCDLADFLHRAAAQRLPFKATAGLHHPIHNGMHGFVNVFVAAAFAWHGMDREPLTQVLEETDPKAFEFDDQELRWHGSSLSTDQIQVARRNFCHSFGSCSFEEPLEDLRGLGWIR